MNRPHARLARDAIQFLQCHGGILHRHGYPGDKAIRKSSVRFDSGIIDELRQTQALLGRRPLPRHTSG